MIAGTIHKTKNHGNLRVVEYKNSNDVMVEFLLTSNTCSFRSVHIRNGVIRDCMLPSVNGVGFIGVGASKATNKRKKVPSYVLWENMLQRCYSSCESKNPTYKDCTVHPDWHNFQNFAKWYGENHPDDGGKYHLDKDLLVIGNKTYSIDSCVFIPQWLNNFSLKSEKNRGSYPVGVSAHKETGMFESSCSFNSKKVGLGKFSTPEAAHLAWRKYKLALALDKKPAMDAIDLRIYPNVVQIITEAR